LSYGIQEKRPGPFGNSLRIGLFGASGLVAQDLTLELEGLGYEVVGFSSKPSSKTSWNQYSELKQDEDLDVLVNLIGGHHKNSPGADLGGVAELDAFGCDWSVSCNRPYVYLSSGVVFGSNLSSAVSDDSPLTIGNDLDPYAQSKIGAELRHALLRSRGSKIFDLRIFSYAGPKFLKHGNYFLSALRTAVKSERVFLVKGADFIRDYIGPQELAQAIESTASSEVGFSANLFSDEPVSRTQILDYFVQDLGLRVDFGAPRLQIEESTEFYYSQPSKYLKNYVPRKSLNSIKQALKSAD
jgi:hypothetical protein